MMNRAQDWVNKNVPYNQKGSHDGYRTDCSGFVSMAWGLAKPGMTTRNLDTVTKPISRNDLQPGDALLLKGTHVVLFGGWTDASKTHFTVYQEPSSGRNAEAKTSSYSYWEGKGYQPIRYNGAQ
eukprot:TRINITY_DN158_c0_g1_i3.p3 TRINITY_DN158_c0_g1~~TRINITY_DN158_c0_g1_i3.p3  ORF type:complete len:124 (-),score=30.30 TRINITY_DN158_c0_g1_i3:53-424(-)